ncbi:hypothetical protein JCM10908_000898 [Rhodotorula pacifica]|uniref:HPP family protein n=1 Tax=Rhodotorula pacifica TaxID=1495444 RepID=UPI00316BBCB7
MKPPYSDANPQGNLKDSWLDKGWPLTRFLGYRPPPAHPVAARHWSAGADHILPAPVRERHRQRRKEEQERKEGGHAAAEEGEGAQQNGGRRSDDATVVEPAAEKGQQPQKEQPPSLGNRVKHKLWDMWLTLIGCFFGIAFSSLGARAHYLRAHNSPIIVAAFGAEAVLLYAAHEVPLTQPMNVIVGNTVSAILGVCVAKLFGLKPGFKVGNVYGPNWAAASVSLGLSLGVMQLLEVTHPPGGATALLAVTIPQISQMGWWYVPMVLQTSLIMLGWALIVNNVGGRRYPTHWFWKSKWIVI